MIGESSNIDPLLASAERLLNTEPVPEIADAKRRWEAYKRIPPWLRGRGGLSQLGKPHPRNRLWTSAEISELREKLFGRLEEQTNGDGAEPNEEGD